ncbi:MAG: CinA family protein [Hydrotalea sp.]|nr:CinA family protein [Hydrotalea sp.]
MLFDNQLLQRAHALLQAAAKRGAILATAESCTGGLLAGLLTSVAGVSPLFHGGVVVYHNLWKENLLAVPHDMLLRHGAVSAPVARAMATGVFDNLRDDAITHCMAITGLAGDAAAYKIVADKPVVDNTDDNTSDKPDGLVFIAAGNRAKKILVEEYHFAGDREAIRRQTLLAAMDLLEKLWQTEA